MYGRFAEVYDLLTRDISYTKWADYLQSAFLKFNQNPKLILELGCGTGSLAVELARRGYEMIALDSSAEMLSRAYEKARENNVDILFLNQDMRKFELYGTVDVILCMLDSINYLKNPNELKKVFALVYNYLNYDGLFIFDVNSPYKLSTILGNETFYELGEEVSWIWKNTYNKRQKSVTFDVTFFVKNEQGLYERFDETHVERIFTLDEVSKAVADAGLQLIGNFGEFSFKPPAPKEERIFYVAKKASHGYNLNM